MGFHYARDHDLAGFWGEVCELAHRVHREAAESVRTQASLLLAMYAAAPTVPLALLVLGAIYQQATHALLILGALARQPCNYWIPESV